MGEWVIGLMRKVRFSLQKKKKKKGKNVIGKTFLHTRSKWEAPAKGRDLNESSQPRSNCINRTVIFLFLGLTAEGFFLCVHKTLTNHD